MMTKTGFGPGFLRLKVPVWCRDKLPGSLAKSGLKVIYGGRCIVGLMIHKLFKKLSNGHCI